MLVVTMSETTPHGGAGWNNSRAVTTGEGPPTPAGSENGTYATTGTAGSEEEQASTRTKLLDAAERLFAEHGIEGVSLRSITTEAGANLASIHYYFRSKAGIVDAIVKRRMSLVQKRRTEMIERLNGKPSVAARDVAEVIVVPLAELVMDPADDRRHYVRFLAKAALRPGPARDTTLASLEPQIDSLRELLSRCLPDIPHQVRMFRFIVALESAVLILADMELAALPWANAGLTVSSESLVDDLVDFLGGGLGAPAATSQ